MQKVLLNNEWTHKYATQIAYELMELGLYIKRVIHRL